jgi:hypothetical protein
MEYEMEYELDQREGRESVWRECLAAGKQLQLVTLS